jgi:D-glycero-beta-D-manno-heptose 1-phosphate adenylyltransferase
MDFARKILSAETFPTWRQEIRAANKKLVVTNGCFDLLHVGHVTYLEQARRQGGALLVGVNGDDAVRQLKGPGRPLNCQEDRAAVIAALESVDGVFIFADAVAREFLQMAEPDIYVKGGDYTIHTLNADERRALEALGARIMILPIVPGKSTTAILNRI